MKIFFFKIIFLIFFFKIIIFLIINYEKKKNVKSKTLFKLEKYLNKKNIK